MPTRKRNMIYIYTIATGNYKIFFEDFINTINNFYPNQQKTLIVLSDGLNEYNFQYINDCNIIVRHVYNTHPKLLILNKFNILEDAINEHNNDNDFIFYFDIDTRFVHNENAEQLMLNNIKNNKINFSRHLHELKWPEWVVHGNAGIYTQTETEYNAITKSITNFTVNKNKHEIITSFFFTQKQAFLTFNKYVNDLISKDLINGIILPLCDEDYVNYIWYLEYTYNTPNIVNTFDEFFITENFEYDKEKTNECDYYSDNHGTYLLDENAKKYIFINQKFNTKLKNK